MIVYVCSCGCYHGWQENGAGIVRPVARHTRYPTEDIWWCPGCDREHRTNDGSMLGQPTKEWRYATEEEIALIKKGVDPRPRQSRIKGPHRIDEYGNVIHTYGLW